MASFASWMLPTKRRWRRIVAGYQDLYDDKGNWAEYKIGIGQLIGTNRSIAAPTLISWRGQMVTKQEMMDLSIPEAMQIYKIKYWNAINGDSIQSQAIADILADMKSSAGGNAIKQMQRVLNELGEGLTVDGSFGSKSVTALNREINKVGQARVFNAFQEKMIAFYTSINNPYEKQLISSLERDYPLMKESWFSKNGTALVVVFAIIIGLYGIYQIKKTIK
jgi:hypothetical protein